MNFSDKPVPVPPVESEEGVPSQDDLMWVDNEFGSLRVEDIPFEATVRCYDPEKKVRGRMPGFVQNSQTKTLLSHLQLPDRLTEFYEQSRRGGNGNGYQPHHHTSTSSSFPLPHAASSHTRAPVSVEDPNAIDIDDSSEGEQPAPVPVVANSDEIDLGDSSDE